MRDHDTTSGFVAFVVILASWCMLAAFVCAWLGTTQWWWLSMVAFVAACAVMAWLIEKMVK